MNRALDKPHVNFVSDEIAMTNAATAIMTDALQKEDGVTDYSKAYWAGKKKKGGKLSTAIDETLAEISLLDVEGGSGNVSGTWRELHNAVNTHYERLKKKRK